MAVTKTLNVAIPYIEDGKVVKWDLGMKYEQGTEGKDDYYTNNKSTTIEATETNVKGATVTNFTSKAEGDWTKKDLEDLCPTAKWDEVFESQYESVITNPKKDPVPNNEFSIPSQWSHNTINFIRYQRCLCWRHNYLKAWQVRLTTTLTS